jgi:hypothetical protein
MVHYKLILQTNDIYTHLYMVKLLDVDFIIISWVDCFKNFIFLFDITKNATQAFLYISKY